MSSDYTSFAGVCGHERSSQELSGIRSCKMETSVMVVNEVSVFEDWASYYLGVDKIK